MLAKKWQSWIPIQLRSKCCLPSLPRRFAALATERLLAARPLIAVPAIVLRTVASGFGPPLRNPVADQARFAQLIDRRIVKGAGHDLPAHRPDMMADALLRLPEARN